MTTALSTNTQPARGLALSTMEDAFRFAQMVSKSELPPRTSAASPRVACWRSSMAARSG